MKRKKFWKRILAMLIVAPIVLLGGIILYIQGNQSEIIKEEVEKLNTEHKGRIRVGESDLSLFANFPYISIKIEDVQIFETKEDDSPIIMNVEDLYIGFNLWDMVQGNYDIQSVVIEDGVLILLFMKTIPRIFKTPWQALPKRIQLPPIFISKGLNSKI